MHLSISKLQTMGDDLAGWMWIEFDKELFKPIVSVTMNDSRSKINWENRGDGKDADAVHCL